MDPLFYLSVVYFMVDSNPDQISDEVHGCTSVAGGRDAGRDIPLGTPKYKNPSMFLTGWVCLFLSRASWYQEVEHLLNQAKDDLK